MKLNKFVLALSAAALLPTFAYASADPVAVSFERALQHSTAIVSATVAKSEADPMDIVNNILNQKQDIVVASFDRDLHRMPTAAAAIFSGAADPLDTINVAFSSSEPNALIASFQRDLYHVPVTSSAAFTSTEVDPLVEAVNLALYGTADQILASFKRDLNRTFGV